MSDKEWQWNVTNIAMWAADLTACTVLYGNHVNIYAKFWQSEMETGVGSAVKYM